MKNLIFSVTLMTCLVLFGFLGSVYGQIDTLMPKVNLIPLQSKRELIYIQKQVPLITDQNSRYFSSDETRKKRSSNFGYGTGIYYQWAWYGGEISNYISDHRAIAYPIINFDFFFKKFVLQAIIFGKGTCTIDSVNINGDNFKGTFYGMSFLINTAVGYEVFENSFFSIIPNFGFHSYSHSIYPESQSGSYLGSVNSLIDINTETFSFGLMVDYKILKMNKLNKNKNSYVSIRLKYDYCLTARKYEYYNGNMHQFTIGLTSTFRNSKIK